MKDEGSRRNEDRENPPIPAIKLVEHVLKHVVSEAVPLAPRPKRSTNGDPLLNHRHLGDCAISEPTVTRLDLEPWKVSGSPSRYDQCCAQETLTNVPSAVRAELERDRLTGAWL